MVTARWTMKSLWRWWHQSNTGILSNFIIHCFYHVIRISSNKKSSKEDSCTGCRGWDLLQCNVWQLWWINSTFTACAALIFFFDKNGVQCSIWSKRNVFSKMLNLPYCIVLICWLRVECWIGMTDQMLNVRLFYCSVLFYKWQITWYHEYALQWKTFYAKCINCWTFLSRKDWEEDMVWYFLLALKIFIWNTMLGSHMFWW